MVDMRKPTAEDIAKVQAHVRACVEEARNEGLHMTEFGLELLAWAHSIFYDTDIQTAREAMVDRLREEGQAMRRAQN